MLGKKGELAFWWWVCLGWGQAIAVWTGSTLIMDVFVSQKQVLVREFMKLTDVIMMGGLMSALGFRLGHGI